jgi:hypothetical protein
MILERGRDTRSAADTTGLALILEANAQACRGVFEHLREVDVDGPVLDHLQELEQRCREVAEELNRL